MDGKTAFNATVCLIGTFILLVHIVNLSRRKRRKDETTLLVFFAFTAFHFTSYAIFTFLKMYYPSDALIMGFYTAFYVMNNLEATLFLAYRFAYSPVKKDQRRLVLIINTILLLTFIALDFINLGTHMFFHAENGVYHRSPLMILSQGYQFIAFAAVFFTSISVATTASFCCTVSTAPFVSLAALRTFFITSISVAVTASPAEESFSAMLSGIAQLPFSYFPRSMGEIPRSFAKSLLLSFFSSLILVSSVFVIGFLLPFP